MKLGAVNSEWASKASETSDLFFENDSVNFALRVGRRVYIALAEVKEKSCDEKGQRNINSGM